MAVAAASPQRTPRRAQYREQGFLSPLTVFQPSSAVHDRIRNGFGELDQNEKLRTALADPATRKQAYVSLIDRHFDQAWMWELATAPAVLDIVEELIGPDILCLATHIFVKHPCREQTQACPTHDAADEIGDAPFVDWHQDAKFWGLDDPDDVVTAWYAIDHSSPQNGCLQVIPRSHLDMKEHGTSKVQGNLLVSNQAVALDDVTIKSAVHLELQPGELSVHHGRLIHGSRPNWSSSRRCGVTLRYMPPSVRQVSKTNTGRGWQAICVRGCDRFQHFGDVLPPHFPFLEEPDEKRRKTELP